MSDHDQARQDRIRHRAYRIWREAGCPEGDDRAHWSAAEQEEAAEDAAVEIADEDSFPASDPPSRTGIIGPQ